MYTRIRTFRTFLDIYEGPKARFVERPKTDRTFQDVPVFEITGLTLATMERVVLTCPHHPSSIMNPYKCSAKTAVQT